PGVSGLSGADDEAVRHDPGVGDPWTGGDRFVAGVRLRDRLDGQAGRPHGGEPARQGPGRVGDRETPGPPPGPPGGGGQNAGGAAPNSQVSVTVPWSK